MFFYLNVIYICKNWILFLKMINVIVVLNFNIRKKMEILMNYIFYIFIMVSKMWFFLKKKEEVLFKINSMVERNRFKLNGDNILK